MNDNKNKYYSYMWRATIDGTCLIIGAHIKNLQAKVKKIVHFLNFCYKINIVISYNQTL